MTDRYTPIFQHGKEEKQRENKGEKIQKKDLIGVTTENEP